jgi:O-antigen ligase
MTEAPIGPARDWRALFAATAARLAGAAVLLSALYGSAASPTSPWWVTTLAAGVFLLALWRPPASLVVVVWLSPWGERLAPVPVRATEVLLFAFFAGWALRVRPRPQPQPGVGPIAGLVRPALVFAAIVVLSWVRLALSRAGDDSVWTALKLVPDDYLVTAGRDPHTAAAILLLLGVAMFTSTLALSRSEPALPRRVVCAVAITGLIAAVASVAAAPITYLMTGDFNEVLRYVVITRSRGSFHLNDVNAAGSLYILAGLLALPLARAPGLGRPWWRAGYVMLVAALWMSGSRAAWAAGALGAAAWIALRRHVRRGGAMPAVSTRALAAAGVVLLVMLTASARLGSASAESGSAIRSLAIRAEFLETSLRMWSTSPVLGVGVGTYYERSSEFMPPGIRRIYGRENAHNYYMQIATELGIVGFGVFLWWLGAALARVWRGAQRDAGDSLLLAVMCGCVAYLLTCVTGHPFLVVEAAMPFWSSLAAGAALARGPGEREPSAVTRDP